MFNLFIQFLFSFLSTIAFGVLTNIPRRALLPAGITGMFGWVIFWFGINHDYGNAASNFLGALCIGIFSVIFSRKMKMPMLVFNIPSLVPLVPGAPAYQAVRSFVTGDYDTGMKFAIKVIITAGAIAAAFLVTNILERVSKKIYVRQ